QLELQTRAASGTLTELVGARALERDQESRRAGLPWGARRKFSAVKPGSFDMHVLEAYADGVNAYIDHMGAADLPLEYRLLGRRPARWVPENTMLLLVQMGYTLAWSDFELDRPQIEAQIGRAATDALFPQNAYVQEPIQPNGQRAARVDVAHLPPPVRDTAAAALARVLAAVPGHARVPPDISLGSNNWAVAPARSASHHALLANDPHLDLSLPSTWYEAHVVAGDSLDTYGVTFPGAPTIILGFNRDVAWGSTNVGADVEDYYIEHVDDVAHPTTYTVDGATRRVERSIEPYLGPHGEVIGADTLYYTHRGPLIRVGQQRISRHWLVFDPTTDFDAFRLATHARSVKEFFGATSMFQSPAQNFIVADREGHIGIRSTGRYPLRAGGERGDRLLDGTKSANDWSAWLPAERTPQGVDPAQGYLASANQQPVDPAVLPSYLGSDWPPPYRAMRINTLLRADSAVTPDAMRRFQTDPGSARADAFIPLFIAAAKNEATLGRVDSTTSRAIMLLAEWDRRFTPDNERAVLFENVMRELTRFTWDELAIGAQTDSAPNTRRIATPFEHVLLGLTRDPESAWWDIVGTPQRETRDMVMVRAVRAGLVRTEAAYGPATAGKWKWSEIRFANIWHALHLPALSAIRIPMQGGFETLNPSNGMGEHGASWRLVAELSTPIRAWGIYPGGQSANPVSEHYRDRIDTWRRGALDTLRAPHTAAGLGTHQTSSLTLVPAR
ncbi:MAG TPA: penicillin acylase family protein, partial [Gemmatimonadaceae bacterium]|nr:penicillin acylase family protein [Gemmatimonadaceae bacterium]